MPSIINDIRRIQRVSSVIIRATERCFSQASILLANSSYDGEYKLQLHVDLFDSYYLDVESSSSDSKECCEFFISELLDKIDNIIKEFEKEDREYARSVNKNWIYSLNESQAVNLTTTEMFKRILTTIKP